MKINNYFNIIKKWVDIVGEVNIDVYEVWKFLGEESRGHLKKLVIVWWKKNKIEVMCIYESLILKILIEIWVS